MKLIRYLLFPIVPFYYFVTWLRNKLFDLGLKKSTSYDFPVICVGNLSVGGTGKTPMIEYLVRLLTPKCRIATLSRGYKRQTEGFIIADKNATANSVGDEPYQLYQKFGELIVSVDADRVRGISELRELKNQPEIILLDDAFQHRKVKAGFNILLTSFDDLYSDNILLPTGDLREPIQGANRADVIIVTKCPETLSELKKREISDKINPLSHQQLFFARIAYGTTVKNDHGTLSLAELKTKVFTLVTGIANPEPLVVYLKSLDLKFEHLKFKDHHNFNESDIESFKQKGLLITTEKDMARLKPHLDQSEKMYYLPIEMQIDNHIKFDGLISYFIK